MIFVDMLKGWFNWWFLKKWLNGWLIMAVTCGGELQNAGWWLMAPKSTSEFRQVNCLDPIGLLCIQMIQKANTAWTNCHMPIYAMDCPFGYRKKHMQSHNHNKFPTTKNSKVLSLKSPLVIYFHWLPCELQRSSSERSTNMAPSTAFSWWI